MKTTWNIVAFIAIANFLGLTLIFAWLGMSGRVDSARVEKIRILLSEPVAVEAARERDAELHAKAELEAAQAEATLEHLSAGSAVPIDSLEQLARREQIMLDRLREENTRDQRLLLDYEQALVARENDLAERIAQFEQAQKEAQAAVQAVEFQTVVKLLESLPPRQAKDQIVLLALENNYDDAVAYLRAMRAGARTELIGAMKSEEERKLASALLNRLRQAASEERQLAETSNAGALADSGPN